MPIKSLRFRFIGLFIIALIFILILWMQISNLAKENKNERLKNETLVFVQTLLPSYAMGNINAIEEFLKQFRYTTIDSLPKDAKILYKREDKIISISIFETHKYVGFYLRYFDDIIIAKHSISYDFWDKYKNYILLLPIIFILLIFQATLFSLLNPLSRITKAISEFARGNYNFELQSKREDELGELTRSFSASQRTIARMLKSRELILRSLGHEIKTPIAKMKLALKSPDAAEQKKIEKYVNDLQKISENILEFERINSGNIVIGYKHFFIETLILEALSGFEDESHKIQIQILDNENIYSDLQLLSVALRNLVDNALKYSQDGKISIIAQEHTIKVINKGKPLGHDFSYYLEPFYRDETHRAITGYGLGLSIIHEILKVLSLKLSYQYDEGNHCFSIHLKTLPKEGAI